MGLPVDAAALWDRVEQEPERVHLDCASRILAGSAMLPVISSLQKWRMTPSRRVNARPTQSQAGRLVELAEPVLVKLDGRPTCTGSSQRVG